MPQFGDRLREAGPPVRIGVRAGALESAQPRRRRLAAIEKLADQEAHRPDLDPREGRTGITIGQWAIEQLEARNDGHTYQLVDILEQNLRPNTALPPRMVENGNYAEPTTRAATSSSFSRIVWHCASASSVPASPRRRSASSST